MRIKIPGYRIFLNKNNIIISSTRLRSGLYSFEDVVERGSLVSQHGEWAFDIANIKSIVLRKSRACRGEGCLLLIIKFKKGKDSLRLIIYTVAESDIKKINLLNEKLKSRALRMTAVKKQKKRQKK